MVGNGEAIDEWDYQLFDENVVNRSFSKRSIAQRREEKCGFNASGISTPAMSPPLDRETFLTIPPGLTPTALLDSPVMLPNSQAPQSPTTGSFQQFSIIINQENSMSTPPHVVINANCPIKTNNVIDHHHHHPLLFPSSSNTQITSRYHEFPKVTTLKKCRSDTSPPPDINNQQNMSGISLTNTTKLENCPLRGAMNPNITNAIGPDDGYTWRKYGQKTVKGSEFPRSYYKCTQQNCFVKKKVERSLNGQITEIIYKGEHNHQKSQPIRRATISSKSCDLTGISKKNEGNGGSNIYRNMQFEGNKNVRALSSLKRTYSPSILTKVSDSLILNNSTINMNVFEIPETIHVPSSTLVSCDDEDEDEVRATEGIISLGDDIDDNEFEHKRRRRDYYPTEINLSSRTTREPRVIVQIESEIEILDDGYRWRKYGQKVVKGNPNPRSYYKCTSGGCPVRKQIERAPHNIKSVITTYEGKHNHEVPSINKTNGVATTATVGNQTSPLISNGKSSILTFSKSHKVSNLETQVQDFHFQFEGKPFGYTRPNFLENQLSDLRCGVVSPLYDLRFPPNLQNLLSCNSFLFIPTQISNSFPYTLHMPDFSLPNLSIGPNKVPPLDEFHFNDFQ
ncbi:hypothetical protein KY285_022280 [Solanum tuberosum]|nr:hypothetical protein KY285_022280 [Solanum tuberosum]